MRVLACLALHGVMICAALMLPAPAPAASQADWEQCADIRSRDAAERTIAACTRIVDDRGEPDQAKIAKAYYHRGNAWHVVGDARRALIDYSEAIRLDPKLGDAYAGRGVVWSRVGEQDLAIADFGLAIRLNPGMAMAYNDRGVARRNKGDLAGAIADYGEAIRLAPDLAVAYRNRGRALRSREQLDQAIADFDAAIRLDPGDAGSLASRCWARAVAGRDLDRALADCNESLRLRPGAAATLNSRGLVHLKRGAADRAVADYAAAAARNGRDADSLFGRGIARIKLGDLAGGEADIVAANAIAPGVADDYVGYGVMTAAAGAARTPPVAAPAPDPAAGRRDYQLTAQIGTRAAWDAFLKAYPSGLHADLARAQLEKLRAAELEATGAIDRAKAEQDRKDRLARAQEALLEQERLARLEAERRGAAAAASPPPGRDRR